MLFKEALDVLKAGKALRRLSWKNEEGYLQLMPGMKYVWKIILHPQPNAGNFIFAIDDFTADDWVEFDANALTIETKSETPL